MHVIIQISYYTIFKFYHLSKAGFSPFEIVTGISIMNKQLDTHLTHLMHFNYMQYDAWQVCNIHLHHQ